MPDYPLRNSYFWERAPIFKILLPLILGIICYDRGWLHGTGRYFLWTFIMVSAVMLASFAFIRKSIFITRLCSFIALQIFFWALGATICTTRDIRNDVHWFVKDTSVAKACLVRLTEAPQEKERTWKMPVEVLQAMSASGVKTVTGNAFLSLYKTAMGSMEFAAGDTVILNDASWMPVKNAGNPFEYDYAKSCARKGIYYQCFARQNQVSIFGRQRPESLSGIAQLHNWSDQQLRYYIKDTATLSLLQAMILGDERNFDPELRQAYSDTGVIHIVSISGSHVAMLFLLVTTLLFWVKGKYGVWLKYIIGVVVVWVYVLMAGAPPSAVRSGLMFSIVATGIIFSKEKQPLNTLFGAAFMLLCYEPMWLFTVGFQLSFAAVLSLTLFYEPLLKLWPKGRYQQWMLTKWIPAGISASLAAEILTAPLVIYYFHNLPLFVVIANLLAAVLVGLCALVGGFGVLVFCWLPPVAHLLAMLLVTVVRLFNRSMLLLQKWTFPSWRYLQIDFTELVLLYCIIALAGFAWLEMRRKALLAASGAACIFLACCCIDKYKALSSERLFVFNTGKMANVELLNTARYTQVATAGSPESYVAKTAHTGWRTWHKGPLQMSQAFLFKGERILVLDSSITDFTKQFPVDILLVSRSVKGLSAKDLQYAYKPRMIVLAGGQPRWYKTGFTDSCAALSIPLHDVSMAGAFILE